MLTRDSAYIKDILLNARNILPLTEMLKMNIADNKKQTELLLQLRGAIALRLENIKANLIYYDSAKSDHLSPYFEKGKMLKEEVVRYIYKMQANEYSLLGQRKQQKDNSEKLAVDNIQRLISIFFIITIILFFVLAREIYIRRNYQEELQKTVIDLKRNNEELEQIAHVLSHDIQEPLRKIQVFSNKLVYSKDKLTDTIEIAGRIDNAAQSMRTLVDDMEVLLDLRNEEYQERIDLNKLLEDESIAFKEKFKDSNCTLNIMDHLPVVVGNYKQLLLLFRCLIDNSIKFSRKGISTKININYIITSDLEVNKLFNTMNTSYHKITMEDNGIGFDNSYGEKIFKIFQQLNKEDDRYKGKGIGLALCRRVMNNHNGMIKAHGNPNKGSIFTLYFSVNS